MKEEPTFLACTLLGGFVLVGLLTLIFPGRKSFFMSITDPVCLNMGLALDFIYILLAFSFGWRIKSLRELVINAPLRRNASSKN